MGDTRPEGDWDVVIRMDFYCTRNFMNIITRVGMIFKKYLTKPELSDGSVMLIGIDWRCIINLFLVILLNFLILNNREFSRNE